MQPRMHQDAPNALSAARCWCSFLVARDRQRLREPAPCITNRLCFCLHKSCLQVPLRAAYVHGLPLLPRIRRRRSLPCLPPQARLRAAGGAQGARQEPEPASARDARQRAAAQAEGSAASSAQRLSSCAESARRAVIRVNYNALERIAGIRTVCEPEGDRVRCIRADGVQLYVRSAPILDRGADAILDAFAAHDAAQATPSHWLAL